MTENPAKKQRGRPRKYATEQEAKEARKIYKREYMKNYMKEERKRIAEIEIEATNKLWKKIEQLEAENKKLKQLKGKSKTQDLVKQDKKIVTYIRKNDPDIYNKFKKQPKVLTRIIYDINSYLMNGI